MKKLILLVGIIFVLMFSMHINSNASATYNYVYNNCALTDTINSVDSFHYFDSIFLNNEIILEKTESIFYDDLIYDSKFIWVNLTNGEVQVHINLIAQDLLNIFLSKMEFIFQEQPVCNIVIQNQML